MFTGTETAAGVTTTTLDIGPSYGHNGGCAIVAGNGDDPAYRLNVVHVPNDGAPRQQPD